KAQAGVAQIETPDPQTWRTRRQVAFYVRQAANTYELVVTCLWPTAQGAKRKPDVLVAADSLPLADNEEVWAVEAVRLAKDDDLLIRRDLEVLVDPERNDVRGLTACDWLKIEQVSPGVLRDACICACVLDSESFLVPNGV